MLDWLGSLPDPLLYAVIVAAAFAENIFPPLPADTVVALGAFVAARGNGTVLGSWSATMVGNIGGAMTMYWVGWRFGWPWLCLRFPRLANPEAEMRFMASYRKYGIGGLMLSRFLPGVRAVVPPLAGAFRVGALRAFIAMTVASAVWYGIICWLAFNAGANAELLLEKVADQQLLLALAAVVALGIVVFVVFVRRRRS